MRYHLPLLALAVTAFMTSACDKVSERPTPLISTAEQQRASSIITIGSSTGVPSAASVFSGTTSTLLVAPTGRPSGVMTPAQEMSGMPIPGQNNDHSAPLATTNPASNPR
jgi:hypothetical protein